MTLDQQLTTLGYVGVIVIAAILIVLGLWLGARQSRDARTRTFWRLVNIQSWVELLASLLKR